MAEVGSASTNPKKIVYIAVGRDPEESTSTLLWAIQNFRGLKFCIFHVLQLAVSSPHAPQKYSVIQRFREWKRRLMQTELDGYLRICTDHGVEAEMLHIEMNSAADGILNLINKHKIGRLIMGADETLNNTEPKSGKANHVKLHASPFCTVYFICNGKLICKSEVGNVNLSVENEKPISFGMSQVIETKDVIKVITLKKLYAEELRMRRVIEEEFEKIKEDIGRVINETRAQKTILEKKIAILEKQKIMNDYKVLVNWEQERVELQAKLDDVVKFMEELLHQSLEALPRTESTHFFFGTLYLEELKKSKENVKELDKLKEERDKVVKDADFQKAIFEHNISILKQQNQVKLSEWLSIQELEGCSLQAEVDRVMFSGEPIKESFNFSTFSYMEIAEATNGLDPLLLLRETEQGNLFKGVLYNTPITMRFLFSKYSFKQEVEVLSKFRHPNIGNMLGACQDASAIVYEHLSNGSLDEHLACTSGTPPLSWQGRMRISLEICSALSFLHFSRPWSVVHCALRPACIFLDSNFTCKIVGFDFSRIISNIDGSSSPISHATSFYKDDYSDPVYIETKEVSPKCDVYSFGIILLQLLTGMPTIGLIEEVKKALDENQLDSLLDASAGDWPFLRAQNLAILGLRCCDLELSMRPDLKLEVWKVIETMVVSCRSSMPFRLNEAPSYFLCPILHEVMKDPHFAADGHTYEAEVLKQWIDSGHNTSPMTNLPFEHTKLTPNLPLRSAIKEWLLHQSKRKG